MRPTVASGPVVSYATVSPLPVEDGRSVLCCAISQVALGGRYPPSCSVEPGSSSIIFMIAVIKRSQTHHDSNRYDEKGNQKNIGFLVVVFREIRTIAATIKLPKRRSSRLVHI